MAGLFEFLKRKKDGADSYPQVEINFTPNEKGLMVSLFQNSKENRISLPLQLSVSELRTQPKVDLLLILDDLWYDEYIERVGEDYLIPFDKFSTLPKETREIVGIPEPNSLDLKLGHEGAVGTAHFRYVLEHHHKRWRHLERTAKNIGPWLILPDQTKLLMEETQYRFKQLLETCPDQRNADLILPYVAEVRSAANQLGIPMDPYLEKQDYLFVDQIDIELEVNEGGIQLTPRYHSKDDIPEEVLEQFSKTDGVYASTSNRQKVFVKPITYNQAKEIRQSLPITGSDIPRFIENPEAFLPEAEGLDLSLFGERVKSLGIRVYKAQPFLHASETECGWFDLKIGFTATDELGEIHQTFQSHELLAQIRSAQERGESYFQWNDNWVRIPSDADSFIDAADELMQQTGPNLRIDITKLPYILEIFENISQLDFNQPILEAQRDMRDSGVLERTPPFVFTASLKPFQEDGYVWLKTLHYRKLGGLLADDMGLGKTIQVVSLLSFLHERRQLTPTLIVVPKTLMENWENELQKFAPSLLSSFYLHRGVQRIKDTFFLEKTGITITTYQTLVRDQLAFGQVNWQAIICDEAQAIKNPSTSVSRVIKAMKSKFRLAMTGTPVENGLSELWSIMDYVQPGLLGSLSHFKQEYISKFEDGETSPDAEKALLSRISMVYKRRTKSEELADQLPSKSMIMTNVPFGKVQLELYREVLTLVQHKMMDGLQAIQKLKALSSHPGLISDKYLDIPVQEVPKLEQTLQIIESTRAKGEKVLIFTEYLKMQEILRKAIRERFDINPMIINGMTNRRQEVVDLFNRNDGFDAMILSPKAAGTGLTITAANHVIHYTRWWNPAVENQATDRVYRIGQNKPVTVYYPIVSDTNKITRQGSVEEIVHRILTEKQELASSVIVSSRKLNIEEEILNMI